MRPHMRVVLPPHDAFVYAQRLLSTHEAFVFMRIRPRDFPFANLRLSINSKLYKRQKQ